MEGTLSGGTAGGSNIAEMYTAAKLAEKLGVSQGKVKKLLEAGNIEADEVKRGCKYYSEATAEKIKALLAKG
ncbi:MAG TPA: tape measure protein [Anaerolineae bacterium]|nr:tape measure protein [Anaerolineae bacterium]